MLILIKNKLLTSYEKYKNFCINLRNLFDYFIFLDLEYRRKCYACENDMGFIDCSISNKNIPIRELIKIWLNDKISIYCCRCYDIMNSFPKEVITEELLLDKNGIANLKYAFIEVDPDIIIDPDVNSEFSDTTISKITLHSYPDGEDVSNFISPDYGIFIPKNNEIKDIKTEKTEDGYKTTVNIKLDTYFNVKLEDIVDKKYLIKKDE